MTPINLSALDGTDGFRLDGIDSGDQSGRSVSSAGDVNGDGFDDIIIGASEAAGYAGESYIVFGKASSFTAAVDLAALDGVDGFRLDAADPGERSGGSVSGAGDVNGDGFDDIIIGAFFATSNSETQAGASYVVFGKATVFPAAVDLAALDGADGIRLGGANSPERAGNSVSNAGDVNGDGFNDIIVGAYLATPNGGNYAGASYVIFGQALGFAANVNLEDLDGTDGFRLDGIDVEDRSGRSVSGAGDVNGDGFDDIIIGAKDADQIGVNVGESYVVFGKAASFSPSIDLVTLDGTDGFRLDGDGEEGDISGASVSRAGDVNGDGIDDIIIGAPGGDPNGRTNAGEIYVVFGQYSGFSSSLSLAGLNGADGFRLNGVSQYDESGRSVSSAGDFNGDGFDDFVISALDFTPFGGNAGESYVVFGKAASFGTNFELATLDGSDGVRIDGVNPGDASGNSVSGAGDVNGDGFDDLLIGASSADRNGTNVGESYVVFGSDSGAVTHQGTVASDTLTGDGAANVIVGGLGDDVLIGAGGADVLRGGAGDDVLSVLNLGYQRVVGGSGADTLRLAGTNLSLDLTATGDQSRSSSGIEVVDLAGAGSGVKLDRLGLLNLSDTSNTLRLIGDATKSLTLDDGGWAETANASGTKTFTNGQAVLVIDDTIQIIFNGLVDPVAADDTVTANADAATSFSIANLLANDSDLNAGDTLTITAVSGGTGIVSLDVANGEINYDPNGQFDNLASGQSDTDTFTYTLSDGNGGNDTAIVTVTVNGVNGPLTAQDDAATTNEDTVVMINVLANDDVPDDNGVLSIFVGQPDKGMAYVEGDHVKFDPTTAFQALNAGEQDQATFTYIIQDTSGEVASASVTVTVNGVDDIDGLVIDGGPRNDLLEGTDLGDHLLGLDGDDRLFGFIGNDLLEGGTGVDRMFGGLGDDRYLIDNENDIAREEVGEGVDTVVVSTSFNMRTDLENLELTSDADGLSIFGNSLDNDITAGDGANLIRGGGGGDIIRGLGGADDINGHGGDDQIFGGDSDDFLIGNNGDDLIDGGAGADQMFGGLGRDTYVVDSLADVIGEAGVDVDSVEASISYGLQARLENLTLLGAGNLNGTGNSAANVLTGNSDANTLTGGGANDTLFGSGGDDILLGQDGDDRLVGGTGFDRVRGHGGADTFAFGTGDGIIQVIDYVDGIDKLELSGFGFTNFLADVQSLLVQVGSETQIQFQTGELMRLSGLTLGSLDAGDFVLI